MSEEQITTPAEGVAPAAPAENAVPGTPASEAPAAETAAPAVADANAPAEAAPASAPIGAASEGADAPEAETEASDATPAEPVADEPVVTEAEGGVLEDVGRKPDASHAALEQILIEGAKITHELLDEIEKRGDVTDVKYLVAFCRQLLGGAQSSSDEKKA